MKVSPSRFIWVSRSLNYYWIKFKSLLRNLMKDESIGPCVTHFNIHHHRRSKVPYLLFMQLLGLGHGLGLDRPERGVLRRVRHGAGGADEPPAGAAARPPEHHVTARHGHGGAGATGEHNDAKCALSCGEADSSSRGTCPFLFPPFWFNKDQNIPN